MMKRICSQHLDFLPADWWKKNISKHSLHNQMTLLLLMKST